MINTPITNTTTRSVPSDRAGMASGMDTSARFISLAINIAVVGLILVKGTAYALEASLPGLDPSQLRLLAEGLSAGTARLDELAATDQAVSLTLRSSRCFSVTGLPWLTPAHAPVSWQLSVR